MPETSLKRGPSTGNFAEIFEFLNFWIPLNYAKNFQKALFTEHLWMIATADSSFQTKVLLLDQTLFDFPLIFFLLLLIFFNCYLAAPQPTLDHYWADSLTHPMLITAFYIFDPRVTKSLITRLGPLARMSA